MANPFNVSKPNSRIPVHGLYLPEADLWLDPHRSKPLAVITHAHADHVASHETVICTPATAALLRARYSHKGAQVVLEYHTPHPVGPYIIELLPAGHVLGSAMVHVTRPGDGATLLYTGDFKLRPSPTAELAAPKPADTLIMETTFGLPHYVFPPDAEVREQVITWCREALAVGETPLLLGYSLGKAQEILALLTGADLPIAVHETVWKMCQVYESRGITFPPYEKFAPATAAGHVLILPPMVVKNPEFQALPNRVTAMLSGWGMDARARYQAGSDLVLPLSDHADYPGLLQLVELVKPQLVLTTHGFAAEFAQDLRRRGQAAGVLQGTEQLELNLTTAAPAPNAIVRSVPATNDATTDFLRWMEFAEQLKTERQRDRKRFLLTNQLVSLPLEMVSSSVDWWDATRWTAAQRPHWSHYRAAVLAVTDWHLSAYRALAQQLPNPQLALPEALAQTSDRLQPQPFTLPELFARAEEILQATQPAQKISLLTRLFRELLPAESHGLVRWLAAEPELTPSETLLVAALADAYRCPVEALWDARWTLGTWAHSAAAAQAGSLEAHRIQLFRPVPFPAASPPTGSQFFQIHVQSGRVEIYDHSQRCVTAAFPKLENLPHHFAQSTILFANSLQASPHQRQSDFLAAETATVLRAHDVLWSHGRSLAALPPAQRQAELKRLKLPDGLLR